jgi:hypothetical protein
MAAARQGAAMSAVIIPIKRAFRPRIEIWHGRSAALGEWVFRLTYVGSRCRKHIGICVDIEIAFKVAMLFRRLGARPAYIEGPLP